MQPQVKDFAVIDSPQFDEKWQELKLRFAARLVTRFDEIDRAWATLLDSPEDEGALSSLFHLVHSLAGSGATFGHVELGARARAMEPMIDPQLPSGRKALIEQRRAQVGAALAELRREAHRINPAVREESR